MQEKGAGGKVMYNFSNLFQMTRFLTGCYAVYTTTD